MYHARWSNGVSYAVNFDFLPDDSEASLTNALAALADFQSKIKSHAFGNRQYSIIAHLQIQWDKSSWGLPVRLHHDTSDSIGAYSWSEAVPIRILPHGPGVDQALLIANWQMVFPLMVNLLKHAAALTELVDGVGDDLKLQTDLEEWDGELRG